MSNNSKRKFELKVSIDKLRSKILGLRKELKSNLMELKGINKTTVQQSSLLALVKYRTEKKAAKKT